jgi:hypothetical protein
MLAKCAERFSNVRSVFQMCGGERMSEFTSGPWEVHPIQKLAVYQPEYECWIPQNEADARLLAAAPELYEACDECLHALRTLIVYGELLDGSIEYLEKKLNAALDKADGEQKARGE